MIRALLARLRGAPKPPGRFWQFANQFAERCQRWPVKAKALSGPRVGVVITPWMHTATPFYSIECARALAESGQAYPVLLWDEANVFCNAADAEEVGALRGLLDVLHWQFEIVEVAQVAPSDEAGDTGFIERLLYENTVRQMGGEKGASERAAGENEAAQAMRTHAARIAGLLARQHFDWLFIPGGVWGSSGLWVEMARRRGMDMTTFDSGPSQLILGMGGASAHFPDIPRSYRRLTETLTPEARARVIAEAHAALKTRREGGGDLALQPPAAGAQNFDLVVPLNYRSDTAAMERQRAFPSVTSWLTQLLEWLASRPGVTIAIRQHPCERIPQYRGTDNWLEVFAPFREALGSRLRFIPAEEPINSYDLLAHGRVVLPWTSRTGIEAGLLGRAVVLGTQCYYLGCGFTEDAATPAEYFAAIERALAGPAEQPPAAREAAALVYYLIERCLSLRTPFTPQPDDFAAWIQEAPEKLWAAPLQKQMLEALLTRQPIAFIQHAHRS